MRLTVDRSDGLRLSADDGRARDGGARDGGARDGGARAPRERRYPSARLARGLLVACGERDLAEEGVGFGVPVVKRGLVTIFPGSLQLSEESGGTAARRLRAAFRLDLVERLAGASGAQVGSRGLYAAKNALAALHRQAPALRGALTATSTMIRRTLRWDTVYEQGPSLGEVVVTYVVRHDAPLVGVEVDLSSLRRDGLSEIVLMNELGARAFDVYCDAAGVVLAGERIGAWAEVGAAEACFAGSAHDVSFSLRQVRGARLFRGRELVGARLAWAGFGYSLPPGARAFAYDVELRRPA